MNEQLNNRQFDTEVVISD